MAEYSLRLISVILIQVSDLFLRTAVDAIQNRLHERLSVFIYRDTVTSKSGNANRTDFLRHNAALRKKRTTQAADIPPPDFFGIHFKKPRSRIIHCMADLLHPDDPALLINDHTFGRTCSHVDPHDILLHIRPL